MQYGRETVTYRGPVTGRVWQLQGKNQQAQPATLLRSPAGLFGTSLTVHRRSLPRSRKSRRVAVRREPLTLELIVDIKGRTPQQTARLVRDFKQDWPDDGTPGKLAMHAGSGKWHYLDVYRTDRVEDLIGIAPMAVGKAKLMIVASSDDPYPYGDYAPIAHDMRGLMAYDVVVRNEGQVPTSPHLYWRGRETVLTISGAAKATIQLKGESLIDLDPEELTVTDANGTRPIVTSWDQSPACEVEPGRKAKLTLRSVASGQMEVHMVPHFEGWYA